MRSCISILAVGAIVGAFLLSESPAQQGTAEQIGKRIDEGLVQLKEEVQEAWADIRAKIDKLSVQGRVYGRLRWDKAFVEAPIEVTVEGKDLVILTGPVPTEETRQRAIRLAKDTVGVRDIVDRLRVEPRRAEKTPTSDK